jgi:predicted transcriptional regulator
MNGIIQVLVRMEQEQCITNDACWFVKLNVAAQCSIVDEAKIIGFIDVLKFMMQIVTSVIFSNWLTSMYISLGIF